MEQLLFTILITIYAIFFATIGTIILFLISKLVFRKNKTIEVYRIKEYLESNNLEKKQTIRLKNLIKGKKDNYFVITPKELKHITYLK
jgi:hypothetical protein